MVREDVLCGDTGHWLSPSDVMRRDTVGDPAGVLTQHTDSTRKPVRENHTRVHMRKDKAWLPLEPSRCLTKRLGSC